MKKLDFKRGQKIVLKTGHTTIRGVLAEPIEVGGRIKVLREDLGTSGLPAHTSSTIEDIQEKNDETIIRTEYNTYRV